MSARYSEFFRTDPWEWLAEQHDLAAVRGRRLLGRMHEQDTPAIERAVAELSREQEPDGSLRHSPMRTATVLALLADLGVAAKTSIAGGAAEYLLNLLASQPGHERARAVRPRQLRQPCDLCGFFGPYEQRDDPEVLGQGAAEMSVYGRLEPLTGSAGARHRQTGSRLDHAGPGACYAWGFMPLAYIVEALSKAGHGRVPRLVPAIHVLLAVQRPSGGWCRSLSGHARCTLHGLRALAAHPDLRSSPASAEAIAFVARSHKLPHLFAYLQALSAFDHPRARQILRQRLPDLAARQRRNGTFGTPCRTEKVVAVLLALAGLDT